MGSGDARGRAGFEQRDRPLREPGSKKQPNPLNYLAPKRSQEAAHRIRWWNEPPPNKPSLLITTRRLQLHRNNEPCGKFLYRQPDEDRTWQTRFWQQHFPEMRMD